jgi:uncharacterized protein YifE (UPF0438 family)
MIRVNNNFAKAMEFTSFKKKETVTDDELTNAVLKFESALANQSGVIFHCLVRNFKNEYANALFVENIEHLHLLSKEVASFPEAKDFFSLIEMGTVKMEFHEILKDDFKIPMGFACIEHGTFTLKEAATVDSFIEASNKLEKNYLSTFDNNLEHFVGGIKGKKVSEVAIGKAYAKTKQVCYGYFENQYGQALLNLADMETVELDFWYLIA